MEIAVAAKTELDAAGHPCRVVSVPSFELLFRQSPAYQADMIGTAPVRIGVEAAVRQGWDRIIGTDGIFVGMESFGASAPYQALYEHFGITAANIVEKAVERLSGEQD